MLDRSRFLIHTLFWCAFVASLFFLNLLAAQAFLIQPTYPVAASLSRPHLPDALPAADAADLPRVSIIVDDAGENYEMLQELSSVRIPLTVSILPGSDFAAASAEWASSHGFEVMAHLPMEPDGYPGSADPGKNALLESMSDVRLFERTASLMAAVPHAAGANNHMGSRLTRDAARMRVIAGALAIGSYYFIDSRTSPSSLAFLAAQRQGLPSAARDVFLDDPLSADALPARLQQLAGMARIYGSAIGICHLKEHTIRRLAAIQPQDFPDLTFTFASAAVFLAKDETAALRRYSLPQRAANRAGL